MNASSIRKYNTSTLVEKTHPLGSVWLADFGKEWNGHSFTIGDGELPFFSKSSITMSTSKEMTVSFQLISVNQILPYSSKFTQINKMQPK